MEIISNYLKKINQSADIKTLLDVEKLIKNHLSKLTFCNIPVLLGKEISLDIANIYEKMVVKKEGGYCFEHNKLIYETLLSLGFEVKPLFGRVLHNAKADVPRTHRITLLTYQNEKYLVDVGFGPLTPNQPIKFGSTSTKTTLNASYVIHQKDQETYELQMVLKNGLYTLYSFDLYNYNEMDYEVGNFYSYKHRDAFFVNNLIVSKILEDKTQYLWNNTYHEVFPEQKKERVVKSLDEFADILKSEFAYPINDADIEFLFEKFVKQDNVNG